MSGAQHARDESGESTERWHCRKPGFWGTPHQLCTCARCGDTLPGAAPRKVFNLFKPNMHFLCNPCFEALPD